MKAFRSGSLLYTVAVLVLMASCKTSKSGCPSNGKNIGAERVLSGEKLPKAKKFKA